MIGLLFFHEMLLKDIRDMHGFEKSVVSDGYLH